MLTALADMKKHKIKNESDLMEIDQRLMNPKDFSKIEEAAKRSMMKGEGHERNQKWRIAEMERKFSMNEMEIW
jgi:hypothetical protein